MHQNNSDDLRFLLKICVQSCTILVVQSSLVHTRSKKYSTYKSQLETLSLSDNNEKHQKRLNLNCLLYDNSTFCFMQIFKSLSFFTISCHFYDIPTFCFMQISKNSHLYNLLYVLLLADKTNLFKRCTYFCLSTTHQKCH